MLKVERRVPVIKKAAVAVKVATTRIGHLKERLQERDATIAQLRQDVASAMADAEKARERADKLEARFTQVYHMELLRTLCSAVNLNSARAWAKVS